jgi:putative ABC transport system permease protein
MFLEVSELTKKYQMGIATTVLKGVSIQYRRKEIAKLILNSSTPVVFLGFGLGLLLMLALGNYLFSSIAKSINMLIPMTLNPLYVLICLVLIFVVYEITKWFCGRKITLIDMSEALKSGSE